MDGTASTPDAAPDWSQIDEAPVCPLCDYNLRGLTQPRCPECGYTFTWDEILDPERRLHPYLFEHHPERNAWSFVRTLTGGLRLRRFWTSLHPMQPSRPRRLRTYALLVLVVYLLGATSWLFVHSAYRARDVRTMLQGARRALQMRLAREKVEKPEDYAKTIAQHGSEKAILDRMFPKLTRRQLAWEVLREHWYRGDYLIPFILPLGWPPAVFAGLMIFQISMRRAKIKTIHVVRCVVYGFDTVAWLGIQIPLCAAIVLIVLQQWSTTALNTMAWNTGLMFLMMVMALSGYRVCVAYRDYLRFDHPIATVLTAHIVAALIVAVPTIGWLVRVFDSM